MSEELTIQTPSAEASAKARRLAEYIKIDVACIEPSNKEPKRNEGDTGYWQTMANLRVKITNIQTGIDLFPEFNALMGQFKADGRSESIIVNCDNSMRTEAGRNFVKTKMSDELHALVYVAALEAYSQKGFVVTTQQTAVATMTGREPSEIMNLVKACSAKAQSFGAIPEATETSANSLHTIASGADEEAEDTLPME